MTHTDDYLDRLVDERSLRMFLEETVGPADSLDVEYHREGQSNETLFLEWGGRDLVLRRPPAGTTADSAHDVLREHRVIEALQDVEVPVPKTVTACDDHAVIGADFYLMEREDGTVLRDGEPERFGTHGRRRTLAAELVDTLVEIHTLDPATVGLDDLGHPDGYTQRQVDRWRSQLEWGLERTAAEREVPRLSAVGTWLAENVPTEDDHVLVHGDYKLDNVMYAPGTPPEITAVFDWELTTRGDPWMDLGWMLVYWPDSGDQATDDPFRSSFLVQDGYPTRRELVERYERQTGRTFDNDRFYRTFGVFKMAAACEMMYRRFLEGNADNESYAHMAERVPRLAERAIRIKDGDEPV